MINYANTNFLIPGVAANLKGLFVLRVLLVILSFHLPFTPWLTAADNTFLGYRPENTEYLLGLEVTAVESYSKKSKAN